MAEETTKKKSGINLKVILIGIPLFAVQVIAIYYITANILLSRFEQQALSKNISTNTHAAEGSHESDDSSEEYHEPELTEDEEEYPEENSNVVLGEHIYSIDDIIVNPSGTDGKRLLLTSVGLDVASEEQYQELEKREILVKDIIISVLASKNMEELKDYNQKDSLKLEISQQIRKMVRKVRVNKVYFSKYIIQ